ncbi:MAG: carboxypeptidase-like regulatory domain-containing protein [Acidobacteriota bacterium]
MAIVVSPIVCWRSIMKRAMAIVMVLAATAIVWAGERGAIRGKVESEAGKPVNGAAVLAQREGSEPVQATTNAKGEFTIELEPGEYTVSVDAQGYKSVELLRKIKVEAGKTTKLNDKILLSVSQTGALLRGAVFTERGFSLPGATVEIERIDGKEKIRKQYMTNQAGEFAFRLSESGGQYKVTASARGFESTSQTVDLQPGESRSIAISLKKGAN